MNWKTLVSMGIVGCVLCTCGAVRAATSWQLADPMVASTNVSVAVDDAGRAAAVIPSTGGTWVLTTGPANSAAPRKVFVRDRFLRYPKLFPGGRLAVQDTGGADEDFPARSLVLDPRTGRVQWTASYPGPHSFSTQGKVAAWMPCYYCASTDSTGPVAQVARQYMDRGLTVALERVGGEAPPQVFSFDGEGFHWQDVGEVIGTGAQPLDDDGNRVLVIWNGVPYIVERGMIHPLPVPDDLGPVRQAMVAPGGGVVVFGLDLGEYAAFDTRTGSELWTTRMNGTGFTEFAARVLGLKGRMGRTVVVPVSSDRVLFAFSSGQLVRYSFSPGETPVSQPLAVHVSESHFVGNPPFATSPNGRFVCLVDRRHGTLSVVPTRDIGRR